jgi:hypothetical protein
MDSRVRRLIPRGARYRLGRALGCCWYHRCDWRAAQEGAIRLLREITTECPAFDEASVAAAVVAEAGKEFQQGWTLEAIVSLFDNPIHLENDPEEPLLDNGQHRLQAMLDAGVEATVALYTA